MPVQTSYPGVYVEEVSSEVRTIVGVSTSVTAFVGTARRGPIDSPRTIFNFSEFETIYGGLDPKSEMSYGVRQFFINGGTQAIIVRVAHNPVKAERTLEDATPRNSLLVSALNAGLEGNFIELRIDYQTLTPESTFNLIINRSSPTDPSNDRTEKFINLSMNSEHNRYVEDVINGISELIEVTRHNDITQPILDGLGPGTASSGIYADVNATLDSLDDTHNIFRVSVNGSKPVTVILNIPADTGGPNPAGRLTNLCDAIEQAVQNQANGNPALQNFDCRPNADNNAIIMTSGQDGENSRVEILPGINNDASSMLMLTIAAGGHQKDAVAELRPIQIPNQAILTSGDITPGDLGSDGSLKISIDGDIPQEVEIFASDLGGGDFDTDMATLASRIQQEVRNLKPHYREFSCSVIPGSSPGERKLELASGSRGSEASIQVSDVEGGTLASDLKLIAGVDDATITTPVNWTLQGGSEEAITPANAYSNFIGSRVNREGIYALESVDIFNILCLPGIHDPGILSDAEAYCRESRAFMIVDINNQKVDTPREMASAMEGSDFPSSDHAAVYFPYLKIADPANEGRLRTSAPSGTLAGLFARTDTSRGVWKAPAGTEATLRGVRSLSYSLSDPENGLLNEIGANCLRTFPLYNAVSWGARTLKGADVIASEYKYISIRRTALFIEESLYRGLKWVVFEPNDEPLWAQIRLNVGAFMHNLFRQGAFQGTKKNDAYFVKCDGETTTQNDINLGRVNILVGFAPLKPAEFVIIKLSQIAGQIEM